MARNSFGHEVPLAPEWGSARLRPVKSIADRRSTRRSVIDGDTDTRTECASSRVEGL